MAGQKDTLSIFDWIARILEKVVDVLQSVGIDLPPFILQIFLLALALVPFLLLVIQFVCDKNKRSLKRVMTVVGLGLIAFGILSNWVVLAVYPFPEQIKGRIIVRDKSAPNRYDGMRVELFDFHGQRISLGKGRVGTFHGRFALPYNVGFGDRPRRLRVTAPECPDREYPIGYIELRAGDITREFRCGD